MLKKLVLIFSIFSCSKSSFLNARVEKGCPCDGYSVEDKGLIREEDYDTSGMNPWTEAELEADLNRCRGKETTCLSNWLKMTRVGKFGSQRFNLTAQIRGLIQGGEVDWSCVDPERQKSILGSIVTGEMYLDTREEFIVQAVNAGANPNQIDGNGKRAIDYIRDPREKSLKDLLQELMDNN